MKREVLALRNYNIKISSAINLKNITLALMEGECTSFLGLISSGKSELVKVICGDEWSSKGKILLDGTEVKSPKDIKGKIHKVTDINYAISDWTVAEYIGLVSQSYVPWIFERSRLNKEVRALFDEINIPIDVNKNLGELTEVEKRIVDLVKAYRKQSKILIIEDELSGLSNSDLNQLKDIMGRIIENRMTVIINANSNNVNSILADKYVILKKGQVIKKCRKDKIANADQLERILLESSNDAYVKNEYIIETKTAEEEKVYSVEGLRLNNNKSVDFFFAKGKVTSILSINRDQKERIFNILSGREIDKSTKIFVDSQPVSLSSIADFVTMKIVSVNELGGWDELMDKMPVGENILMPSLKKFSTLDYLKSGNQMSIMLKSQLIDNEKEYKIDIDSKNSLRSIFIMMERWYVFKPKVLVLYEPFYQCDIYGISIIKTYINNFKKLGTSIIIVKSRSADIEDISDNIIKI